MHRNRHKIGSVLSLCALLYGAVLAPAAAPAQPEFPLHLAQAAASQQDKMPRPAKAGAKTRSAQSKQVSVHVFLLSDQPRNPEEYLEANGIRYIYFNSPRLLAPARPLGEPKPRYPQGKLAQQDGAVILQLLISELGVLEQASVVCSAPPFEKSARDSVKGLKFAPARGKDGPVKSYMLVEFGYGRGYPCARLPD